MEKILTSSLSGQLHSYSKVLSLDCFISGSLKEQSWLWSGFWSYNSSETDLVFLHLLIYKYLYVLTFLIAFVCNYPMQLNLNNKTHSSIWKFYNSVSAGIDYLPSLQLILRDQLLRWVLTCPWGPLGHPLLWVLIHQPHPWCKENKSKQCYYFYYPITLCNCRHRYSL